RYLVWQSQYWRRRGVPGPTPQLFFGNVTGLNKYDHPMPMKVHEWTKEFGKVYGYKDGVRNVLVISDMDMVNDVFVKQFDAFYARRVSAPPLAQDTDKNPRVHLFEAKGSRWKRLRALASPSFSINSLKKIRPIIEDSAIKMVYLMEQKQRDGKPFNIQPFFSEFTLDSICRLVFGQKESTMFENPRMEFVQSIFLQNLDRPIFRIAAGSPTVGRALRNLASKVCNESSIGDLIRLFPVWYECQQVSRTYERYRDDADFIDLFLDNAAEFDFQNHGEFSTQDSVTKALTVDEVIAQAVVFLLAGYDTTSNALAYTAWMLSRHHDVMKRCQEEIDDVCSDSSISYEDCQNMRYLDAVCRETLRFYPLAARALSRTCMKDTTVGNYDIAKDTVVMADTYAVHFSEELWGEDAHEFRPERWMDQEKRVAALNFLTFGAGHRLCIGMRLATMEEKIALAHLLRRFDILADEKVSDLKLIGSVTTTPSEVIVKIRVRS
ncbi:hypothetical protein PENTCL1PPCAC_24748, partial [Pristionchus entomophagus]